MPRSPAPVVSGLPTGLAVVVGLGPNRGLTVVFLGRTSTTKAGPGAEFQKEFENFQFKLNLC